MLIQVIAVEYLRYLQFDRNFKDMAKRRKRIGQLVMFWLDRDIGNLTYDDLTEFKKSMLDRQCKPSYINTFIFMIRSLFRFANERGIKTIDPKSIKPYTVPKKHIVYLGKEQIIDLLKYFGGEHLHNTRNKALTAILIDTGMRIGECLSLNRAQYDEIMAGETVITGKFSKQRPVFFTWSRPFLKSYMEQRTDDHEALFITHCHDYRWRIKRLHQDGYRKYLREANRDLDFYISPHTLRKTAINNWKANGMDVKAISLIAGHDSVMTTEKYYLGIDWKWLKKQHVQYGFI